MSPFAHTLAQQEAISTLDRNLLVLASAGTGKTYVLVRRFLHILEHTDWPVSSIVALTFTKLAAQEMRVRILREVHERTQQAAPPSVWHRRSEEMSQLQVSTVHSFCERLLRQHAVEAGIDPDFVVMADDEAALQREQAIRCTLADMAASEGAWLEALPHYTRQDLQQMLCHAFAKRSTLHHVLDRQATDAETLQADWHRLVTEEMDRVWRQYAKAHPDLTESMAWLETVCGPGRQPVWEAEDKLGRQMMPALQAVHAIRDQNWTAAVEIRARESMIRKQRGAKTQWHSEAALEAARHHVRNIHEALTFLRQQEFSSQADPHAPAAARAVRAWLQVWDKALAHYTRRKQAQLSLDYDDLEIRALELLQRGRQTPDSRAGRFVAGIRQVLADEHQDINPVQQQLIDTLAPITTPGRLFVVGDTKQSIYRFRQAQVTAFAELAVRLRQETGCAEITLDASFRTQKQLVAATNRLFRHVLTPVLGPEFVRYEAKPLPLSSDLEPLPQQMVPVELHIVQDRDAEQSGFERKQDEVRIIANRLIEMKAAGMPVRIPPQTGLSPDQRRTPAFQWQDAAILLRSSRDMGIFETVFRAARIPYQVVAEVPLHSRLPVRALLALLRHLHRPADDFNLAVALRSPLFGLDDETLYWLTTRLQAAGLPLHRFADMAVPVSPEQAARLEQAAQILATLYPRAHTMSPEQLLLRLLEETGLPETCMADADRYRGTRHLEEIKAFQAYLRAEQHRPLGTLLRRCTALGISHQYAEETGPAHADGRVRIMTIHKSKGLEFPVVFVPQLDRRLSGGQNATERPMLLFDPEFGLVCQLRDEQGTALQPRSHWAALRRADRMRYVETKRILYVACTRAADLLVLTGVHAQQAAIGPRPPTAQGYAPHWLSEVLAAYDLRDEHFAVGQPCTVTRCDDTGAFRLRCTGHQAGAVHLQKAETPTTPTLEEPAPGPGRTARARPLEIRVEDLRDIDRATRSQRIGTFTHDLVTQWHIWFSMPRTALQSLIATRWRQTGAADPQAEAEVLAYLTALRTSPLARAIEAAPVKHWELPIALATGPTVQHRRVDLLYQNAAGQWHLVDWKTEKVTAATLPATIQRHLGSLATYAHAIERLLGAYPAVSLCFLAPEIRVVPVSRRALAKVRPA